MSKFERVLVFGFALTVFGLVSDLASAAGEREGTTEKCRIVYISGDAHIVCPKAPVVKQ